MFGSLWLAGRSETRDFAKAAPCELHACLCPTELGQGPEANLATPSPRPGCAVPTETARSSSRATEYGLGSLGLISSVELYNTVLGFQGGNEVTRVYSGLSYPRPLAKNTSLFLVVVSSFLMMMGLGNRLLLCWPGGTETIKGKNIQPGQRHSTRYKYSKILRIFFQKKTFLHLKTSSIFWLNHVISIYLGHKRARGRRKGCQLSRLRARGTRHERRR